MRKQFLLTLMISLLAVSAWGTDVSVTETFGDIRETSVINPVTQTFDLTFCQWEGCRIRKNGQYEVAKDKNGNDVQGADWIKLSENETIDAIWMAKDNDNVRYIRTTNLTGGIKKVSTRFAQFGSETKDNVTATLIMKISAGNTEQTYTLTGDNMDKKKGGCPWDYSFELKNDGQLKFENVSTGGSTARRILLGHIVLTPYLMYTQKEANIDLNGGTYTHPIINNTEGESGTLTFESSAEGVATVTNEGVVTPVGIGNTTITATYTWNETHSVTASYTLYVSNNIKETFSGVEQTTMTSAEGSPWSSDYFFGWQAKLARRGSDDNIGNSQCSWLATGANQASLTTTNLEGGIKSVYFPYAQFGAEPSNYLKLQVRTLDKDGNIISSSEKTRGKGSNCGNNKTTGLSFYWESNCAQNAQLQIINTSVNRSDNENPLSNARWLVGDIVITPYIYYKTRKANIEIGSNTYVNTDLINNTAGEDGTLTFSSAHPTIATVDENSGVVTGVAVGCTEIIATYKWSGDAGEVTTRYQITVNQPVTETFADVPTLSNAEMIETISEIHKAQGSLCEWEYYRIRREESTDELKSGVQGWWTSGSSATSGNYLRTKEALEGGVKALSFDWRQYGSAKGAHVQLQVTIGDESPVNMVDYSVAVNGENDETDKVASKMDWNVKENAQISISNISTTTTDKQGRVVIGQIYITPYIYYTKKSAVVAVGKTYTNTGFINNTVCEGGTLSYETSDESIATVSGGVVTGVSTGEATITAKYTWDETHFVTTTYTIHVVENNALIEDFSKAPTITSEDSRKFYEGNYHTWYYRNISNNGANYILNDGTKGFWMNHKPKADKDAVSSYFETTNTAEGGIKHVSFKWHQFGNAENQTIYLSIKVNGAEKDKIEVAGGKDTVDLCVKDQTYDSNSDVVSKSNAKLTISNVSYVTGSDPKVDAQGRVIIGPISITPYLFYMQREAHVLKGERYTHPLLDNTDGEGTISYSISDASVASINSSTGEVLAKASGNATVKATWSEGAYTTYTLHVAYPLADAEDNSETIGSLDEQTVDIQLADRTIRTGGYNTLCLPFAVSEGQLKATLGDGVKAYEFTNAYLSGSNLDIRFDKVEELEAGKPYLVTVTANVPNPVFESVTIDSATTNNIIKGENMWFKGSFNNETMNETGLYIVANSLYRVENITSWDKTIGACRAYFDVPTGAPALGPVRMRIIAGTNTATDVETVDSQKSTVESRKILRDGQLIIIRGDKEYNAQGQVVK